MNQIKRLFSTNKYSKVITQPKERGAAQAMLYALNLTKDDLKKPQIGIGSMWFESNPCNVKLDMYSSKVKESLTNY